MHSRFTTLLCFCLVTIAALSQKGYGVDQDYYVYRKDANSLVPRFYYQSEKGWYGQVRYNYEEEQTLSAYAGKSFGKEGKKLSWSVTPQVGLLAGRFTGTGPCLQAEMQAGALWVYTEPEYCFSFTKPGENFFYNWSEVCLQPVDFFYAGFALQQTKLKTTGLISEPGLTLGFAMKNIEIPLYLFNPGSSRSYFVLGLHWKLEKGKHQP